MEEFLPFYTDTSDENLIFETARKKEFYELKLGRGEARPPRGELIASQKIMKRFFSEHTPYSEALVIHGLGTGKTCVASAIIENFKNVTVNGLKREPALFFVKSEDFILNVKQEIVNVCTYAIYTAKPSAKELASGADMSEQARIARLNKSIAETYELVSYQTILPKLPSDEIIRTKYSNRIIVLDEPHILREQPKKKKSKKGGVESEENEDEAPEMIDADDAEDKSKVLYWQMHRFMHAVESCRKFLFTGTPIWDKPNEIANQMNLILPVDEQLPTGKAFNAKFFNGEELINAEDLRKAFAGRVSFLREMTTTARREEIGVLKPWMKHFRVYPCGMDDYQTFFANRARELEVTTISKGKERQTKGGAILKLARDASNFVFPIFDSRGNLDEENMIEPRYGPKAFEKFVVKKRIIYKTDEKGKKTSSTVKKYALDENLKKYLSNIENLRKCSSKLASLVTYLQDHPDELIFVYNDQVASGGGGCIMTALVLELYGMAWAKTSSAISTALNKKPLPGKPLAGRRFAVITSDEETTSDGRRIQELINSINQPDNKYGSRCQLLIGSEKISVGITLKNFRVIVLWGPHWNFSALDQAGGRVYRFEAQASLPENERYVKTYRYAAVEKSDDGKGYAKGEGFPKNASFSKHETTDIHIYGIAENKDYKNAQIYREAQKAAVDCALTYERNVVDQDVDGTRECRYTTCNYKCENFPDAYIDTSSRVWKYQIPEDELDLSTYHMFYSSSRIENLVTSIVKLFNSYFSLRLELLQELLDVNDSDKILLLRALEIVIDKRILIRNRYGFGSYLKESGNTYFLDNSMSLHAHYSESVYSAYPLISERNSFEDMIDLRNMGKDKMIVKEFCSTPDLTTFSKLSYKTQVLMLESAYILRKQKGLSSKQKDILNFVLEEMGDYIYQVEDATGEKKIINSAYAQEYKGEAYDVSAKEIRAEGLLRVYNPNTSSWSGVTDKGEEKEYARDIKNINRQRIEKAFDDNPYGVYGWISKKDGRFRIVKKEEGTSTRGRVCGTPIRDLYEIFFNRIKELPKPDPEYKKDDRKTLLEKIEGRLQVDEEFKKNLKDKDDDYLRRFLTLTSMNIDRTCETLKEWLQKHNLLFERA